MTDLPVTMACGPYDRLQALKEGVITPEIFRAMMQRAGDEIIALLGKTG